jgi:protein gp37
MSNTTIQWTATKNADGTTTPGYSGGPWLGCSVISPGCTNCYAKALAETRLAPIIRKAYRVAGLADWETRPVWGDKAPRVLTKGFWEDAKRVNLRAAKAGKKVFWFPSMIDWLDEMPAGIIDQEGTWLERDQVLADFLKLIHETDFICWQLLTKRPENWRERITSVRNFLTVGGCAETALWLNEWLPTSATSGVYQRGRQATTDHPSIPGEPPDNVWIGVSTENQKQANERVPELRKIPALVKFISAEPLLGPIDFREAGAIHGSPDPDDYSHGEWSGINLIIFGGESGADARPCSVEWIRDGVRQCKAAGTKAFVKQLGAHPIMGREDAQIVRDKKGGTMEEWPSDLKVREIPNIQ